MTGLDYQTLRNYAWVARRFGLSRRRDSLSFGHHAEVASLPEPEQDFWLRKAEAHRWPVKQLRHQVRASLAERTTTHHDHGQASHGQDQDLDQDRGGWAGRPATRHGPVTAGRAISTQISAPSCGQPPLASCLERGGYEDDRCATLHRADHPVPGQPLPGGPPERAG